MPLLLLTPSVFVTHLLLQAGDAHCDVLLADGAGGWALPEARVALEALRRELAVEELDDELRHHVALCRIAAAARRHRGVEGFDVRVAHVVLPATARPQRDGVAAAGLRGRGCHERVG